MPQEQQKYQYASPAPSLPSSWIMDMTEDGTDCYYYNKLTGEMRTSPPPTSSSALDLEPLSYSNSNDSGFIKDANSACTFDGDDDDVPNRFRNNDGYYSNQESLDDDEYDFQSVTSRLDGMVPSSTAVHDTKYPAIVSWWTQFFVAGYSPHLSYRSYLLIGSSERTIKAALTIVIS